MTSSVLNLIPPMPLWTSTGVAAALDCAIAEKWIATGVAIDSRSCAAGDIFVAIRGEKTDGHLYAAAALERGAVVVIVDHAIANIPDTGQLS